MKQTSPLCQAPAANEAVVDMDPCGGIHYLAAVNCELILFNTHRFSAVGLVTEQTYILPTVKQITSLKLTPLTPPTCHFAWTMCVRQRGRKTN